MKRRGILSMAFPAAGCLAALVVSTQLAAADSPSSQASAASGPATLGSKETAKWTDSTTKAAGTPEQKAVLDGAKVATITGELVEVSCYLQLGKRGEKHIPCGSDCLRHGQPAGIVDSSGKLTILFVEEHDPRRNGEIDIRDKLVGLLAKQVTATGMLTKSKDGSQGLFVQGSAINATK